MKRSIYTCVVFCACGFAFGGEPTPAEPQSVLINPPAATQAAPVAAADCDCHAGKCCPPRRTHSRSVTEGCTSDGCQTYSVRAVEDEVTRRRWLGGGTVVRKNSRTIQRAVR